MKILLQIVFISFCLMNGVAATPNLKPYPVGELGERWTLGSDHLPVGGTIGSLHFVLWNILSTDALHYIEENGQGLKDSFITAANLPSEGGLTVREAAILDQIFFMMEHPTHPRSLLALQETSEEVYKALKERLPPSFEMLPAEVEDLKHGDVFIYDTKKFEFLDFKWAQYQDKQTKHGNTYMALSLRETTSGMTYRWIQSHVPGGPDLNSMPSRLELADFVIQEYDPNAITVVLGDMNRGPELFMELFHNAALKQGLESNPFTALPSPYASHVNTHREASWIDNIFVFIPLEPLPQTHAEVNSHPDDFFPGLKETVDLLDSLR